MLISIHVDRVSYDRVLRRVMAVAEWAAQTGTWGERVAGEVKDALGKATETWNHQPDFRITARGASLGSSADVRVVTDDKPFMYVNEGTRPHAIRAKNGRSLAFPGRFTAKTTPGVLQSGPGFSGGPTVLRQEVWHPGTQARHFDELAATYAWETGREKILDALQARWEDRHSEW
jgi:hypothetical protein